MTHKHKRWYDYDPLLIEVIDLLKNYQEELHAQAVTIKRFYHFIKSI